MPKRSRANNSSTVHSKRVGGAERRNPAPAPNAASSSTEISPILGLEDEKAFQRSLDAFVEDFHPESHAEFNEVKNMALAQWNHDRFQAIQNELLEAAARNSMPCNDLLRQVACGFQRSVDSSAAITRAGCLSRAAQSAFYAAQKALFLLQDRRDGQRLGGNRSRKAGKSRASTDKPCAA